MKWEFDDGGREAAGYKGRAGDCVCRAIAIATGKPYQEVYDDINRLAKSERTGKRKKGISSAREGVYKATIRKLMAEYGWEWHPTMQVGSGCTTHLKSSELPAGRLVVNVSKHTTAVIDGVCHDTYDPSRDGTRCVYGYYTGPYYGPKPKAISKREFFEQVRWSAEDFADGLITVDEFAMLCGKSAQELRNTWAVTR